MCCCSRENFAVLLLKGIFQSGGLLVDEAADVAKSISATNENALAFIFLCQFHQAVEKSSVINHRRMVEDKLMSQMDLHGIHILFKDSQHAGDKRRKVQECFSIAYELRHWRACVCIYILINIHRFFVHISVQSNTYYIHITYIHPSIHPCMHACMHTYIHTYIYIYIYIWDIYAQYIHIYTY